VMLHHGVALGGTSLQKKKRHRHPDHAGVQHRRSPEPPHHKPHTHASQRLRNAFRVRAQDGASRLRLLQESHQFLRVRRKWIWPKIDAVDRPVDIWIAPEAP
jgi:hypothetical protein